MALINPTKKKKLNLKSIKTQYTLTEERKILSRLSSNDHLPSNNSSQNDEISIHSKRIIREEGLTKTNFDNETNITKTTFKKKEKI